MAVYEVLVSLWRSVYAPASTQKAHSSTFDPAAPRLRPGALTSPPFGESYKALRCASAGATPEVFKHSLKCDPNCGRLLSIMPGPDLESDVQAVRELQV